MKEERGGGEDKRGGAPGPEAKAEPTREPPSSPAGETSDRKTENEENRAAAGGEGQGGEGKGGQRRGGPERGMAVSVKLQLRVDVEFDVG